MAEYLPRDMMQAEDDQMLAELGQRTMLDVGLDSPTARLADVLDPQLDDVEAERFAEMRRLNDGELRVLLLYAKLGRNAFERHWEDTSPPLDDGEVGNA